MRSRAPLRRGRDPLSRRGRAPPLTPVEQAVEHPLGARPARAGERILKAIKDLRDFLYEKVYFCPSARVELVKTEKILKDLYAYVLENPAEYVRDYPGGDSLEKRAVDFIAGMTDSFALAMYEKVFFPRAWPII